MGERMQVPGDAQAAEASEFETGNQGGAGQSGGGAYPNPHSGKGEEKANSAVRED